MHQELFALAAAIIALGAVEGFTWQRSSARRGAEKVGWLIQRGPPGSEGLALNRSQRGILG